MQMMMDLVSRYGPWLWFAAASALLILETMMPGVHFLWFGVSAAIVGVVALLLPMALPWQLILFALISVFIVYAVRRYTGPTVAVSDEPVLNVRGAQYIGRTVVVEDDIRNGRGKVRVGDTLWPASGEDAPAGARVTVTGVDGTVLVVAAEDE